MGRTTSQPPDFAPAMSGAPLFESSLRYAPRGFKKRSPKQSKTVYNHLAQVFTILLLTFHIRPPQSVTSNKQKRAFKERPYGFIVFCSLDKSVKRHRLKNLNNRFNRGKGKQKRRDTLFRSITPSCLIAVIYIITASYKRGADKFCSGYPHREVRAE